MKAESQRENEDMLALIRGLNKEVKLQTLVINSYIPHEYLEQLEAVVQWQEETGEWNMVSFPSLSPSPSLSQALICAFLLAGYCICWQQHEKTAHPQPRSDQGENRVKSMIITN